MRMGLSYRPLLDYTEVGVLTNIHICRVIYMLIPLYVLCFSTVHVDRSICSYFIFLPLCHMPPSSCSPHTALVFSTGGMGEWRLTR